MKTIITTLLIAICLLSCGPTKQPHPPYTIISIKEGDGCCDLYYEDSDGTKGHACVGYENLKKYKKGDVLKIIPF